MVLVACHTNKILNVWRYDFLALPNKKKRILHHYRDTFFILNKTMDKSADEDTVASDSASDSEKNSASQFSIYNDTPRDMTYARRIARSLAGFGLYNPSGKHDATSNEIEDGTAKTKPSLDKGWEFFEHVVLPRCLKPRSQPFYGKLQRAEPGEHEKETMLYPIWGTPMNDMADFGTYGESIYCSLMNQSQEVSM